MKLPCAGLSKLWRRSSKIAERMELVRSNRTEVLAGALTSVVQSRPLSPFEREVVVVQGRGVERWLTLFLAERLGVWANPSFPFPRAAIESVLDDLQIGDQGAARAYDPPHLKWHIAEVLRSNEIPELQGYLGVERDPTRVVRLAEQVARAFDRYVVYRPELIRLGLLGDTSSWQTTLWRAVVERLGPNDLGSRIARALPKLRSKAWSERPRFRRLHLFALETLPPLFLEFFVALAESVPTFLYSLEPTVHYASGLEATSQLSLPLDLGRDSSEDAEGHPLLSSLGRLCRDFQEMLLNADISLEEIDAFPSTEGKSLLASLQSDILEFRGPPEPAQRRVLANSDQSISVHHCPSPMREVQVLHDLIRSALEDDPSLRPEDIIVMTPDLPSYAPAFEAVFRGGAAESIPFEVHGLHPEDDFELVGDLLAVLETLQSRFTVLDVTRLLECRSLRDEFRFTQEEQRRLGELLQEAGVRWGVDAEHREELGFSGEGTHCWRNGLARLFLGFASMPGTTQLLHGLISRGSPSLSDAELVGRLSNLCELLFDLRHRTKRTHRLSDWVSLLHDLTDELFFTQADAAGSARVLRDALQELGDIGRLGAFQGLVTLTTIGDELRGRVTARGASAGFLRRGVTLTEVVPLRSIPFRMICLLGMSEESYPRADDRPSFDLTRRSRRIGDRTRREDDRHSFLQAVLCARERVVVTYSPRLQARHRASAPSAVVQELIEVVSRYYERASSGAALPVVAHPLHPFDEACFDPRGGSWSFSERHAQIAEVLREPPISVSPVSLRADEVETPNVLTAQEMTNWLWHPLRAFVRTTLQTRLDTPGWYEPTRALIELGGLAGYKVGDRALQEWVPRQLLETHLKAAPEFPEGRLGTIERSRVEREVATVAARREALCAPTGEGRTGWVRIAVRGLRVEEAIDGLQDAMRVMTRFSRAKTKAELGAWVEHLLINASGQQLADRTLLVLRGNGARAVVNEFGPVPEARQLLESLVDLCVQSRSSPAPLVPNVSWVFAEQVLLGIQREKALKQARSDLRKRVNAERPYLAFAWKDFDPFESSDWVDRFEECALLVYEPLLKHRSTR